MTPSETPRRAVPTRSARDRAKRIRALRKRDGDACWLCGKPIDFTLESWRGASGKITGQHPTLDHVVERRNGGHSNLENLRLAHSSCNNDRDTRFRHTAGPPAPGSLPGYPHPQPLRHFPNAAYLERVRRHRDESSGAPD